MIIFKALTFVILRLLVSKYITWKNVMNSYYEDSPHATVFLETDWAKFELEASQRRLEQVQSKIDYQLQMTSILIAIAGLFAVNSDCSFPLRMLATLAILFLMLTFNLYNEATRVRQIITPDSDKFSSVTPQQTILSGLGQASCRYHQIADFLCDISKASWKLLLMSSVLISVTLVMFVWIRSNPSDVLQSSLSGKSGPLIANNPQVELLLLSMDGELTQADIRTKVIAKLRNDINKSLIIAVNRGYVDLALCSTNQYQYKYILTDEGKHLKKGLLDGTKICK
jgi:hypothetical protein